MLVCGGFAAAVINAELLDKVLSDNKLACAVMDVMALLMVSGMRPHQPVAKNARTRVMVA